MLSKIAEAPGHGEEAENTKAHGDEPAGLGFYFALIQTEDQGSSGGMRVLSSALNGVLPVVLYVLANPVEADLRAKIMSRATPQNGFCWNST